MSFFDEWMKKKTPPSSLSRESIKGIDRYDRQDMDRIADEYRDFRVGLDSLKEVAPKTGISLWCDAFMAFFKTSNAMRPAEEMQPSFAINHRVMEEVFKLPEYERLRPWTIGDVVGSAASCVDIEPHLKTFYDRTQKQQEELEQWEKDAEEYLSALEGQQSIDDMIEDAKNSDELTPEELQAMQDLQDQINESMAAAEQALRDSGQLIDDGIGSAARMVAQRMRPGMQQQADEAQQAEARSTLWGMNPGAMKNMNAEERMKLANRLKTDKITQIFDKVGAMKNLAFTEQTRKVYFARDEIYNVGLGNDLARVLPTEMAGAFSDPIRSMDFFRKYADGKLMQYEMQGTEKMAKGGIIMPTDNSGSMAGANEFWMKALGLVAMMIARDQGRPFYGIHFSSRGQIEEFDFRNPDEMTLERVLDYAEHFFNGGTDFEEPLTLALTILQDEFKAKGAVEGDIVFVTDGMCGVSDVWLENFKSEQERLGFKVWGMLIGSNFRDKEPLNTICDGHVAIIKDLVTGEDAREMFREL